MCAECIARENVIKIYLRTLIAIISPRQCSALRTILWIVYKQYGEVCFDILRMQWIPGQIIPRKIGFSLLFYWFMISSSVTLWNSNFIMLSLQKICLFREIIHVKKSKIIKNFFITNYRYQITQNKNNYIFIIIAIIFLSNLVQ